MKTFLHLYDEGGNLLKNIDWDFPQLPHKGDFVCIEDTGPWYEVRVTVHRNFPDATYEAEVYAGQVVQAETVNKEFPGEWSQGVRGSYIRKE